MKLTPGTKTDIVIRKASTGEYIAVLWEIVDGKREHIITMKEGRTYEEARDNLKKQ